MDEYQRVLNIPPFNPRIVPDAPSHGIRYGKVPAFESFDPIFRPLLIEMPCASLKWNRCGEQNHWAKLRKGLHKNICGLGRKVFRNLKGNHQVETPVQL